MSFRLPSGLVLAHCTLFATLCGYGCSSEAEPSARDTREESSSSSGEPEDEESSSSSGGKSSSSGGRSSSSSSSSSGDGASSSSSGDGASSSSSSSGTVPLLCDAATRGEYTGTIKIRTTEQIGETVINEVICNGTYDLTVADAPGGEFTCIYTGSKAFNADQGGTIVGECTASGPKLTLSWNPEDSRIVPITVNGTFRGAGVAGEGTSSWLPHPMSAVAWKVWATMTP